MKNWLLCFLVSLLFMPSLSLCEEVYGIAKFDFDLRSHPSFDGTAIRKIYAGEKIVLLEKDGAWAKTTGKNNSGWVALNWITHYGDLSKLPSPKISAFNKIVIESNYMEFNPPQYGNSKFRVFAREGPSMKSNSSTWLKDGEQLIILGVQDDWLKIKTEDNEIAWIGLNLVDMTSSSMESESVQKAFKKNKIEIQIANLKSSFNELPPSDFKGRLDLLKKILQFDANNYGIRELAEHYSEKIHEKKILELEARVRLLPASDIHGNLKGYKELAILDSNNPIYKKKVAHYSSKFNENERLKSQKSESSSYSYKSAEVSASDINALTTYAVIIGRAIACGVNTDYAMRRVGSWMDDKFPPGSADQKTYLPIFISGVKYHATQQKNGESPDTCSQVRSSFSKLSWP